MLNIFCIFDISKHLIMDTIEYNIAINYHHVFTPLVFGGYVKAPFGEGIIIKTELICLN